MKVESIQNGSQWYPEKFKSDSIHFMGSHKPKNGQPCECIYIFLFSSRGQSLVCLVLGLVFQPIPIGSSSTGWQARPTKKTRPWLSQNFDREASYVFVDFCKGSVVPTAPITMNWAI